MNTKINTDEDYFLNFHVNRARDALINDIMVWKEVRAAENKDHYKIKSIQKRFYEDVRSSGNDNTYWCTKDAYAEKEKRRKQPTLDHYNNPRLVCGLLMDKYEYILHDKELFKEVFLECRKVVGMTRKQNDMVKSTKHPDIKSIKSMYNEFSWIRRGRKGKSCMVGRSLNKFPLEFIYLFS